MARFNRILHPTDFSPAAMNALKHAALLASKNDCPLDIVHVNTWFDKKASQELFKKFASKEAVSAELRSSLKAALHGIEAPIRVETNYVILEGARAAREILDYAHNAEAELIVMGSVGDGLLEHTFLGSVATRVARKAECSVLIVPDGVSGQLKDWHYKNIMLPVDLSDNSAQVLKRGTTLAKHLDAQCTAVHSILPLAYFNNLSYNVVPQIQDGVYQSAAEERLEKFLKKYGAENLERAVVTGVTVTALRAFAIDHNVDLAVMTPSGHGAVSRAILGSCLEGFLNGAPCPVLITKNPDQERL